MNVVKQSKDDNRESKAAKGIKRAVSRKTDMDPKSKMVQKGY